MSGYEYTKHIQFWASSPLLPKLGPPRPVFFSDRLQNYDISRVKRGHNSLLPPDIIYISPISRPSDRLQSRHTRPNYACSFLILSVYPGMETRVTVKDDLNAETFRGCIRVRVSSSVRKFPYTRVSKLLLAENKYPLYETERRVDFEPISCEPFAVSR